MLKVLIVDDEAIIRLGLREKINWEELGFTIVGEASNGVQAFQLTQELKPDVVLTDMKMPVWDGIQLLKAYEEHNLTCKVIVISAYSSFQYTQSAIKHGAFDYILKPIDRDELEETLKRVKQEISSNSTDLDTQGNTTLLTSAREQFLSAFLETDLHVSDFLDSPNTDCSSVCIAVNFPSLPNYIRQNCDNSPDFFVNDLLHKLQAIISPPLKKDFWILPALSQKNTYVFYIILRFSSPLHFDLISIAEQIQAHLETLFCNPVSLGISNVFDSSRKLNGAIAQARNALSYRPVSNSGCVILYDCIPQMYTDSLLYSTEAEHTFLASLEICNYEEVERNIQNLFIQIRNSTSVSFRQVYKLITNLLFLCERVLRKYNIAFDEIFSSDITSIDYIAAKGNLNDLEIWFLDVVDHILDLIASRKQANVFAIVSDIQNYIDNHYWEDINLAFLSKKYHINKSYLSEIFKKHTGKTYVDYLSTVRLDHAANLLLENTKYKIHEVAQLVGYVDSNYFSKCFKKRFGLTPEQHRIKNKH